MAKSPKVTRPSNFGTRAYLRSFIDGYASPRRKPHVQTKPSPKQRVWHVSLSRCDLDEDCLYIGANTKSEARAAAKRHLGLSRLPVGSKVAAR